MCVGCSSEDKGFRSHNSIHAKESWRVHHFLPECAVKHLVAKLMQSNKLCFFPQFLETYSHFVSTVQQKRHALVFGILGRVACCKLGKSSTDNMMCASQDMGQESVPMIPRLCIETNGQWIDIFRPNTHKTRLASNLSNPSVAVIPPMHSHVLGTKSLHQILRWQRTISILSSAAMLLVYLAPKTAADGSAKFGKCNMGPCTHGD